eukprot:gene461-849_t
MIDWNGSSSVMDLVRVDASESIAFRICYYKGDIGTMYIRNICSDDAVYPDVSRFVSPWLLTPTCAARAIGWSLGFGVQGVFMVESLVLTLTTLWLRVTVTVPISRIVLFILTHCSERSCYMICFNMTSADEHLYGRMGIGNDCPSSCSLRRVALALAGAPLSSDRHRQIGDVHEERGDAPAVVDLGLVLATSMSLCIGPVACSLVVSKEE